MPPPAMRRPESSSPIRAATWPSSTGSSRNWSRAIQDAIDREENLRLRGLVAAHRGAGHPGRHRRVLAQPRFGGVANFARRKSRARAALTNASRRSSAGGSTIKRSRRRWRALNFIFFDDEARFADSLTRLTEALQTDIGWVRKHTEYGEAARRWNEAGRSANSGLLLRSHVLEDAERWIGSRPPGAPSPTEATAGVYRSEPPRGNAPSQYAQRQPRRRSRRGARSRRLGLARARHSPIEEKGLAAAQFRRGAKSPYDSVVLDQPKDFRMSKAMRAQTGAAHPRTRRTRGQQARRTDRERSSGAAKPSRDVRSVLANLSACRRNGPGAFQRARRQIEIYSRVLVNKPDDVQLHLDFPPAASARWAMHSGRRAIARGRLPLTRKPANTARADSPKIRAMRNGRPICRQPSDASESWR